MTLAANYGHVGVIKSLIGSPEAQQSYKEAQFRLSQRKQDLEQRATIDNLAATKPTADDFSPLAVALLEQQTEAARALIETGADINTGYASFGNAVHLSAS